MDTPDMFDASPYEFSDAYYIECAYKRMLREGPALYLNSLPDVELFDGDWQRAFESFTTELRRAHGCAEEFERSMRQEQPDTDDLHLLWLRAIMLGVEGVFPGTFTWDAELCVDNDQEDRP